MYTKICFSFFYTCNAGYCCWCWRLCFSKAVHCCLTGILFIQDKDNDKDNDNDKDDDKDNDIDNDKDNDKDKE